MSSHKTRHFMAVMRQAGLDQDAMRALIDSYTQGRTSSRRELTDQEAEAIIRSIQPQAATWTPPPGQAQRRKLIAMARELGWEIETPTGYRADMARIDTWCITYGYLHKPLNAYTPQELPRLVAQYERVYLSTIQSSPQ